MCCVPKWVYISRLDVIVNQSRVRIHRIPHANQLQLRYLISRSMLRTTGQSNFSIEVNMFDYELLNLWEHL